MCRDRVDCRVGVNQQLSSILNHPSFFFFFFLNLAAPSSLGQFILRLASAPNWLLRQAVGRLGVCRVLDTVRGGGK